MLIDALNRGETLERATDAASAVAGTPVDGAEFVLGLAEAGMLATPGPAAAAEGAGRSIGWVYGVSQPGGGPAVRTGRLDPLRVGGRRHRADPGSHAGRASHVYSDLWFVDDRALATLALVPLWMGLGALHELWHWLAGRAVGVPAVLRLRHRGPYLAFETDLTQIVALPRRER